MGIAFLFCCLLIIGMVAEVWACKASRYEWGDILNKNLLPFLISVAYIITCIISTINYEIQRVDTNIKTEIIKLECIDNKYITEKDEDYLCYYKDSDSVIALRSIPKSKAKIYKNKGDIAKIEVYSNKFTKGVQNDWFFKLTYLFSTDKNDTTYKIYLPV